MTVERYVTLQEAVQQYGLDTSLLIRFVEEGRIRGGQLDGTYVLLEEDTQRVASRIATKEQLREKVAHLENHPIGMREAARKYDLNDKTISRWAKTGYIRVLCSEKDQGRRKLIDESDVAYAKKLVKMKQAGQGDRIFTTEYIPDWFQSPLDGI